MSIVDAGMTAFNIAKENFNKPDGKGEYRSAYVFSYLDRKYVFKIDNHRNKFDYGCLGETKVYQRIKGTSTEAIVAPVIANGKLNNHFWVIMPYYQMIKNICPSITYIKQDEYLKNVIFPQLCSLEPQLLWNDRLDDRMEHHNLGTDIHAENVGMNNRGRWFIFDYGTHTSSNSKQHYL